MAENTVSYSQHVVLNLFEKDKMTVEQLKNALEKAEGSGKAIHILLSKMQEKGLVKVDGEGKEKTVSITKAGKKAAKEDRPEKPEKRKPKAKATYTPLFSEEELSSMKKKKRKKAEKKMQEHYEKWLAENKGTRNTSDYKNTVPVGKWQSSRKTPGNAAKDLWENIVTTKVLMTRKDFCEICESEHGINKVTAGGAWRTIGKHYQDEGTLDIERFAIASGSKGRGETILPPLKSEEKKSKKKKSKKDKKGKKKNK